MYVITIILSKTVISILNIFIQTLNKHCTYQHTKFLSVRNEFASGLFIHMI